MCVPVYIYIHMHILTTHICRQAPCSRVFTLVRRKPCNIYIYIYIYYVCVCVCVCMYIYIYMKLSAHFKPNVHKLNTPSTNPKEWISSSLRSLKVWGLSSSGGPFQSYKLTQIKRALAFFFFLSWLVLLDAT